MYPSPYLEKLVSCWRFNKEDYKNIPPQRPTAECMFYWLPLYEEACSLYDQLKAEADALPQSWRMEEGEEFQQEHNRRLAIFRRVSTQEREIYKLCHRFSYELAHAQWWDREFALDRANASAERKAVIRAAREAERQRRTAAFAEQE